MNLVPGVEVALDCFHEFGDKLDEEWKRSGYDERELPRIACDLMGSERILERIDVQNVLRTAAQGGRLDALQMQSRFGDLSYVVFRNTRFYIEVLVWTAGTTSIHDHAFSGAFGLVCGDSICVTYDFDVHARIHSRFKIGKLAVRECQHLKPNDVRPILEAPRLIHSVYHIANPTVTLVVRTPVSPEALPQLNYQSTGMTIACPHRADVIVRKQCQAVNVMLQTGGEEGEECAIAVLERASIESRYEIVKGLPYDRLRARFVDRVRDVLAATPFGTLIWDSLRSEGRRAYLIRLRERIRSPGLRRFHAAMLNIRDGDHLADFCLREMTEEGCRGEVGRCMDDAVTEGVVRWDDDDENLGAIVCGWLFERSRPARDRLARSRDLFLECLANNRDAAPPERG